MAVKYADKLVLLNERDSKDLKNIYGKGADFLFKMTVKDQYYKNDILKIKDVLSERKKILFVGSDFLLIYKEYSGLLIIFGGFTKYRINNSW